MKSIIKFSAVLLAIVGIIASCEKADKLPFYASGTTPTLSSDASNIAPVAADSNNVVLNLNWSYPNFATDSASAKYIVQIDAAGSDFATAYTKQVIGDLTTAFTAKEFNTILLAYGYSFDVAYDMVVRVIASYANNNDRQISNTISLSGTPYKIPPRVALPASGSLFIVGSATVGGWSSPVPVPSQEFARVEETKWAGVFYLTGGQEYLLLPQNTGSFDNKYAVTDNAVPGINEGGDFGQRIGEEGPNQNFAGPSSDGWYKLEFDFQSGKFTVLPSSSVPADLFIIGGATVGGWNNPVPDPQQRLTKLNSSNFEIELDMIGAQAYLLLPTNGSWGAKYGGDNATPEGGTFKADGSDLPGPANSGKYKIEVSFLDNTYKVEEAE